MNKFLCFIVVTKIPKQICCERTVHAIHGLGLDCLPRSTKYGVIWLQTCCAIVMEGCSTLSIELEDTVQAEIEESGLKCFSAAH